MKRVQCDGLVNEIEHDGDDEHLGNSFPAILDQKITLLLFGEQRPTIGWIAFSSIAKPVSESQPYGDQRLEDESKVQGTVKTT
jgi:hypothetical protein